MDVVDLDYLNGYSVGFVMGALIGGARSVAASWPENAWPEHREKVEGLAHAAGLVCSFKSNSVVIEEPTLKIVADNDLTA